MGGADLQNPKTQERGVEARATSHDVIAAGLPAFIAEDDCVPEALPAVRAVNRLIRFALEIETFVAPLSQDDSVTPLPSPAGLTRPPSRRWRPA